MGIVSTSSPKKGSDPLLELSQRKQQLKRQIKTQEAYITSSTKQLFAPLSIVGFVYNLFKNKNSIYNGIKAGLHTFSLLRDLFKSK